MLRSRDEVLAQTPEMASRFEPCRLDLGQVERTVLRSYGDGVGGAGVVVGGGDGCDAVGVVSGELVDLAGDVVPGGGLTAVRDVVGTVVGVGVEEVADGVGDGGGEGEAPVLVVDDFRVDAALGECGHGADEVVAVADDPAGADDVVAGGGGGEGVAGGFGLPVDTER